MNSRSIRPFSDIISSMEKAKCFRIYNQFGFQFRIKMNIFFLLALLPQALFGLSIRKFSTSRLQRNHNDQPKFFNKSNKTHKMKRKNSKNKQIITDFELNHQNCYIISQPDHRRQIHCIDAIPHHGEAIGLFTSLETAAKWLFPKKSDNFDLDSIHG